MADVLYYTTMCGHKSKREVVYIYLISCMTSDVIIVTVNSTNQEYRSHLCD